MRNGPGVVAAALLGAQLTACASLTPRASPDRENPAAVVVREDLSGRFIALIGLKTQHDPPYLGTSGTNFSCLRSFMDRRSGETAEQLYVAASYDSNHDWNAAHDGAGRTLTFIPISRLPIVCKGKTDCSYSEEFAAKLPEDELIGNPRGFSVTFTDAAGNAQTIAVSAAQVQAQVAALAELKTRARPAPTAAAR